MRYSSIDLLRMLAIIVMVFVHFGENLSGVILPFAGFGAPLFALLSGVSYALWVRGQQRRGKCDEIISRVSIRRGLFVLGVGFAFNVVVWLPEDTFNWDVLTLIGVSILLLNLLRRLPRIVSLAMALMAVLISPLLRVLADYNSYWEEMYFQYDMTFSDITIGFLVTGYFPVFPWIAYSLVGAVVGGCLFETAPVDEQDDPAIGSLFGSPVESNQPSSRLVWWQVTLVPGIALLAVGLLILGGRAFVPDGLATTYFQGWSMYPPTICYVTGTLGMSLMMLGALHYSIDRRLPDEGPPKGLLQTAQLFSQYSFTIYLLHHIVHIWPLWIYGALYGTEATQYWRLALPISVSSSLALLFLVVCYFCVRILGVNRRYGIEAWMRWLCD
ncbi:MAG: heparan-alpha-glucosaminide N-acetyltransferase domain-containing protein [Planctomycetaceae bacterium]